MTATAELGPYSVLIPGDHPTLARWRRRFERLSPHFDHLPNYEPGSWIGMFVHDRLLAAFGYTLCVHDVVAVEFALCEPSRAGRIALAALMRVLYTQWRGRTLRFHIECSNRRMRRMVESLGATPVALMYELGGENG